MTAPSYITTLTTTDRPAYSLNPVQASSLDYLMPAIEAGHPRHLLFKLDMMDAAIFRVGDAK